MAFEPFLLKKKLSSNFSIGYVTGVTDFGSRDQKQSQLKGLILAQNERWRRGLGMQVEREVSFCLH